jgi:lysophospholipase L1-like esterase
MVTIYKNEEMKNIVLFFFVGIFLFTSCSKIYEEEEYLFIGDSLVYYWDLDYYLPLFLTTNAGLKGAKINNINEDVLFHENDTTVLLIGTNDLSSKESVWTDEFENNILIEFKKIFMSVNCNKLIIISILPRIDIKHEHIKSLNKKLEQLTLEDDKLLYLHVFDYFTDGNEINVDLYTDGLHLSRNGYSLLSNTFINFLK